MAGKREKVLFAVFLMLLISVVTFVGFDLYVDRMKTLETLTGTYREQIESLERKLSEAAAGPVPTEDLDSMVREALGRFYLPGEIDPYRFALRMQSLLESEGITVEAVRTVAGKNRATLEYVLESDALSFMKFLRRLGEEKKYVRIDSLSISRKDGGNRIGIQMRVGYEEAPFQAP